jgi:hypothetical protein
MTQTSMMTKSGTYKIFPEDRLIVEYHAGDINIDDFIESRKVISSAQEYSADYDLVLDFRDVNMIVTSKDIARFVDFFRGFDQIHGTRKSAYLTRKPNEVVVTTLFSMKVKDSGLTPMTFSTIDALVLWLNKKKVDKDFLNGIIEELKTQPDTLYI